MLSFVSCVYHTLSNVECQYPHTFQYLITYLLYFSIAILAQVAIVPLDPKWPAGRGGRLGGIVASLGQDLL